MFSGTRSISAANVIGIPTTLTISPWFRPIVARRLGRLWCRCGNVGEPGRRIVGGVGRASPGHRGPMSAPETKRAKGCDHESRDLISGERPEHPRSGAGKFVAETKNAVTDQIKMKMLAGQYFSAAQGDEDNEAEKVEGDLGGNGRPTRNSRAIAQGIPRRRTYHPQTTTMKETADAAEADADRRDQGKVVTRRSIVADMVLREFNEEVSAEKCAEDRFPRGELEPHVSGAEMLPAFAEKIDDLRTEEGADESGGVDDDEPFILAGAASPKKKANRYAGEQKPGVR